MNRRNFMGKVVLGGGTIASATLAGIPVHASQSRKSVNINENGKTLKADLIIAGAGLGGCSAAFAALRNGLTKKRIGWEDSFRNKECHRMNTNGLKHMGLLSCIEFLERKSEIITKGITP